VREGLERAAAGSGKFGYVVLLNKYHNMHPNKQNDEWINELMLETC
jgi:hypothetical protein